MRVCLSNPAVKPIRLRRPAYLVR
ncbi:DUF1010 domain-containing protein [Comamonas granuli]